MGKKFKTFKLNLKKSLFNFLIAKVAQRLIRLILFTCKVEVRQLTYLRNIAKKEKCIVMFWHDRLSLIAYILSKHAPEIPYAAFISKSRDGDLQAAVVNTYPYASAIRVSHNARHVALREMIKAANDLKVILITPDGPKGPPYEIKPGMVYAAKVSQSSIIPLTWYASKFWKLNTWDKMMIPKPFSKVIISFGEPIRPHQLSDVKFPQFRLLELENSVVSALSSSHSLDPSTSTLNESNAPD